MSRAELAPVVLIYILADRALRRRRLALAQRGRRGGGGEGASRAWPMRCPAPARPGQFAGEILRPRRRHRADRRRLSRRAAGADGRGGRRRAADLSARWLAPSPLLRDGKLRALAVAGDSRVAALAGRADAEGARASRSRLRVWYGLLVPAATPRAVQEKIADDVIGLLRQPEIQRPLHRAGGDPGGRGAGGVHRPLQCRDPTLDRHRPRRRHQGRVGRRPCASPAVPSGCCRCCRRSPVAQVPWPDKPVRLIVGYTAGGPTDFVARLFQDPLSAAVGPAGGDREPPRRQRGARRPRSSPAARRTATPCCWRPACRAATRRSTPSCPTTASPISPRSRCSYGSPTVLFVPKDSPLKTARDVVAAGRSGGHAGLCDLGQRLLRPLRRRHVRAEGRHRADAYRLSRRRAGAAGRGRRAGADHLLHPVRALTLARGGAIRAIAVCAPRRVEALPDVPTLAESDLDIPRYQPLVRPGRPGRAA